jgi:hypothetical protein
VIAVTFVTARIAMNSEGNLEHDNVVAARLRIDLEMAKAIRDMLTTQIESLTPPQGKPN